MSIDPALREQAQHARDLHLDAITDVQYYQDALSMVPPVEVHDDDRLWIAARMNESYAGAALARSRLRHRTTEAALQEANSRIVREVLRRARG